MPNHNEAVPIAGEPLTRSSSSESNNSRKSKKRKLGEEGESTIGMGQPLSLLRQPDLPEFNLTSTRYSSQDAGSAKDTDGNSSQEWQTVSHGRPAKKAKKIPKPHSSNYPSIKVSPNSRLQSQIKISDLQGLVLYILADGTSPQFVSVAHRNEFRKVVVLMVPGLEIPMFEKTLAAEKNGVDMERDRPRNYNNPDEYYPKLLKTDDLAAPVKPFADIFEHIWPVKTPGDDKYGRMHSPLHAMLTAPQAKSKEDKGKGSKSKGPNKAREPQGWQNTRTRITEFIHTPDELLENDYTLHPASYTEDAEKNVLKAQRESAEVSAAYGWVDTLIDNFEDGTVPENEIEAGSLTAGRELLAMDCEMCKTGETEFSLTRISIVGWDGTVVLDELVKPEKPIIDYLTMYSGITEKMLANVTTTLQDIQQKLVKILHPRTILIGHSLNSDMNALKMAHPFIIDTAIIYPHPRGPPLKSALKWLAQKYLGREIQKGHGSTGPGAGHDSIEDAKTCLDLVKQKCEKGKEWGTSDSQGENIFKRLATKGVRYKNSGSTAVENGIAGGKTSAAIDWGNPKLGAGAAATHVIGCKNDEEVMEGVIRATKGDPDGKEIPGGGVDFVWARMRELESLKGWWNNNKNAGTEAAERDAKARSDAKLEADARLPTIVNEVEAPTSVTLDNPEPIISPEDIDVVAITTSSTERPGTSPPTNVEKATSALTTRISKIYAALPPCTALIIFSGSGDPREMSRLQAMQTQFKKEYKTKKWDELSVRWTDTEEQALRRASKEARNGCGFIGVK